MKRVFSRLLKNIFMHERYFDNAATTPVDERVIREMLPFFNEYPGNAASIHDYGRRAQAALLLARQRITKLINADDPMQITFTSGATESNNWVLSNYADIAVSPYEHSSVRKVAKKRSLPNYSPEEKHELVAHMWVNNEVGTIFDIPSTPNQKTLADVTQGLGKLPFSVEDVDYVSASGHKFYAPKGTGFLYQKELDLSSFLIGGEQEFGQRGSTVNIPGAVAIGAAAAIASDELPERVAHANKLNEILSESLSGVSDFQINGPNPRSPYILSCSFLGIQGETLLIELDQAGFCCSAGAACNSTSTEPSPVLIALGIEPEWIRGTIRVSFGKYNTAESTLALGQTITRIVENLRKFR
jgi:cysteine desulfurase